MIRRRTFLRAGTGAAALAGLPVSPELVRRARTGVPWDQLAAHLHGRLVRPTDPDYPMAKKLDLGQFDSANPQGVAYCIDDADVATCLAFAQDNRLPFAVRGGGHSGAGYSTSTGLVIDVTGLNAVSLTAAGTVTAGGGAQGVDVVNALAPHGLAVPGGYCPTVGVGGYYLPAPPPRRSHRSRRCRTRPR